jgi:ketosteroid isomerase-like protein
VTDIASVKRIIENHNANLEKWYAEGKIDEVAQVFSEDCWQMPPNAKPMVGREALREGWKQAVQLGQWTFTLDTRDVMVSGDLAVERGKYTLEFVAGPNAPRNMPSHVDKGNYVVLWRREDDETWRIVWDAPVSELPIPGS